jgi:hypothetical protein
MQLQTKIHQHVVIVVIFDVTGTAPTTLRPHQENHP